MQISIYTTDFFTHTEIDQKPLWDHYSWCSEKIKIILEILL